MSNDMSNDTGQRSKVRLVITELDLCRWLGEALPRDVLQYHRGFLALDTAPHSHRLGQAERAELTRVARRAQWAVERGLAHLLQRRHGNNDYTYLLVARMRPKHEPVFLPDLLGPEALVARLADDRPKVLT